MDYNIVKKLVIESGRHVAIPDDISNRDKIILQAYNNGASPTGIALEFGITRGRVHQIINKYRNRTNKISRQL